MGAMNRRLRALERRLGDRDFNAGGPPLDEDGLPNWDDSTPLTTDGYMRALGCSPDEELTTAEAEARARLSPYMQVFANLDKPSGGAP